MHIWDDPDVRIAVLVAAAAVAAVGAAGCVWGIILAARAVSRRAEHTRREIALLPGPLTRRLLMAGRNAVADPDAAAAAPDAAGATDEDVARPNVIVFLLDALSRQTAASVLPNFLSALRGAEADMAPSVAASLEYEHFGIVGMNSKPNWAAMLCGGNCSGHWAVPRTNTLPLLDAARAAGFASMHLNNFYPGIYTIAISLYLTIRC
jgi:hypothetical protein